MKVALNLKRWLAVAGRGFERHPWLGLLIIFLLVGGVLALSILPNGTPSDSAPTLVVRPVPPTINKKLRDSLIKHFEGRRDAVPPEHLEVNPF